MEEYKEVIREFISEAIESSFREARKNNSKLKSIEESSALASQRLMNIQDELDEKKKAAIQEYMDLKNDLTWEYSFHSYEQGAKDCVKLLRLIKLI